MGPGAEGASVTIPAVMISLADCNILRAEIPGLSVEISQGDNTVPTPGPTARDGNLDNGIIAHEYGHGISIRQTGGPSSGSCLFNEEQAGEGWSDYFGLVHTIEPGDQGTDARGIGTYAINEPITGGGIRPFPYSTDMNINPHTYDDIKTEAVPHGVGSVWCAMIWDMTWALIDEYGFDPDIYYGTGGNNIAMRLVNEGLKMQACTPGFVDNRQGILDADNAFYGGANQCLIWEVFARRGLGWSASQGTGQSVSDGSQAFDIPPFCLNNVLVEKTAPDQVEASGVITYTFDIFNPSENEMTNVVLTDEIPDGTTYVAGSITCGGNISGTTITIPVGDLAAGQSITCSFQVIAPSEGGAILLEDGAEEDLGTWTPVADVGTVNWQRVTTNPSTGSYSWFAQNIEPSTDFYLELTNPIPVTPGNSTALVFEHFYDSEASWDGGVVEIMGNAGVWQDLGNFMVQNGYNSVITDNPASAISGRPAFSGNSGGYITTVAYLNAFINQDVRIRFRFASDEFVFENGWHVDNIRIIDMVNITNEACVSATGVEGFCDDIGIIGTVVLGTPPTSVGDVVNTLGIDIFPNPTEGKISIDITDKVIGDVTIETFSVDGKSLLRNEYDQTNSLIELDLSNLGSGIYMIRVSTSDATAIHKVILQ